MPSDREGKSERHHRRPVGRTARAAAALFVYYAAFAYLVMPEFWRVRVARHPGLVDVPFVTRTTNGLDGDPLNVALVGTRDELLQAMPAAGWLPADPITLESSLRIVEASLLRRPYAAAPVSDLFLFGRREDFAFEKPVGDDPRQRHHVRFWLAPHPAAEGRPVWIGAAVFDERVGLSRETGQVTHVTAADIDAERRTLFDDLTRARCLTKFEAIDDFHRQREGRNGGGDPWHTDGKLFVGYLAARPGG